VMRKLARVASFIVTVSELCGKHNLNEEDLPAGLLAILVSLQGELDGIERVLKKCSRKRGFKGLLLRKDLLTKIKQCDGELSNVLQAFQAGLALETRFASIAEKREVTVDSSTVEATSTVPQGPDGAQTMFGIKGALDVLWSGMPTTVNAEEAIVCRDNFVSPWDQFADIKPSMKGLPSRTTALHRVFFFGHHTHNPGLCY